MSDEINDKKRKPANDAATAQRTDNMTSGDILRLAREKKKLSVEDISSAIHVRAAQIRAIEEGNIDALPGMTYAVGFVKSYAGYLKLNPIELGNKFKAEHGALKPVMPDLPEPKPIVESRMPDPMLVGVAAFCALVLLLGWTFFSGDDEAEELALTNAVVAESTTVEIPPQNVTDEITAGESVTEVPSVDEDMASETRAAEAETVTAETDSTAESVTTETEETEAAAEAAAEEDELLPEKKPETVEAPVEEEVAPPAETINIRKAGRVVFQIRQPSWIQVTDANERVVFKRLMKPGEQYTVPEGKGYTLITTNAGGFDVLVDGRQVQALGKQGEILRALPLEPAELQKIKRVKSRINN